MSGGRRPRSAAPGTMPRSRYTAIHINTRDRPSLGPECGFQGASRIPKSSRSVSPK